MIILAGLVLMGLAGELLRRTARWSDLREMCGLMMVAISVVFLFGALVGVPAQRATVLSFIEQREAIIETVEYARASGDAIERAAVTQSIAEANADLRVLQFWNAYWGGWLVGIFIPDAVIGLEPIR